MLRHLSKIGSDVILEVKPEEMTLSTLNNTKSAYACATFAKRFFRELTIKEPFYCSISLQHFADVFKKHGKKASLKAPQLCHLEEEDNKLKLTLLCPHGILKIFRIVTSPTEPIRQTQKHESRWICDAQSLSTWVSHLHSSQKDIRMTFTKDKVTIRCFCSKGKALETVMHMPVHEFEEYELKTGAELCFSLMEMKQMVHYAEQEHKKVEARFGSTGQPISFYIGDKSLLMLEMVLSTMETQRTLLTQIIGTSVPMTQKNVVKGTPPKRRHFFDN